MLKILLIDDDESMRPTMQRMLERLGHQVWAEADGDAGLARARQLAPDLVITDIIMPERDGIETIEGLRRLPRVPKIIAISGGGRLSAENLLALAGKLGAQYTLAKPFTREELQQAIERVMGDDAEADAG